MNIQQLKDACEKAKNILIEKYNFSSDCFAPYVDSYVEAPFHLDDEFVEGRQKSDCGTFYLWGGNIKEKYLNELKGTSMYWKQVCYESDEWSCQFPIEVLEDMEMWENITDDEWSDMINER